jgi:hypothetical protein
MYTNIHVPSDCCRTAFDRYCIVKYPKDKKHDPAYRLARSLIYKDDTLVCFSPPKSIDFTSFTVYDINETVCTEFIDGTMINAFYDEGWIISTKSILGAECTFVSQNTFANLFYSCLSASGIDYIDLNTSYTYSFVIQHPDNIIVLDVKEPKLYLVGVYEIMGDTVKERDIPFLAPRRYTFDSYETAASFVQEREMKGLMFTCNGFRAKINNDHYSFLSRLKGNSPFNYHYLVIRNTPQKEEYMKHFQQDISKGIAYERKIEECASDLLNDYKKCFIYKEQPLKTYMKKNYMYDLHGIFLNELKPKFMTKPRVLEYMNSLPPNRLLTLLQMR